jgi:hypothetical protein
MSPQVGRTAKALPTDWLIAFFARSPLVHLASAGRIRLHNGSTRLQQDERHTPAALPFDSRDGGQRCARPPNATSISAKP